MPLPPHPRAVLTGAGSGFGRALALELATRGAHLVVSDVNLAGCAETVHLALDKGAASAVAVRCDVTKVEEVEALSGACEGEVDLVVNNAGVGSGGRIGELPLASWRWTLEVDLFGVIHGCHVFVPRLRAQGHGHVLNVASAAGLMSMPRMAAYNVAKAGVVALTETLKAELAGTPIGVTALCPTFFKSGLAGAGRFSDDVSRGFAEKLVGGGIDAEAVAKAALKSVDRDELYSVPMADGRWGWRLKRVAPGLFASVVRQVAKRVGA
jgi:NAD(P)-dependent dehydrogenase (short-subunit alcohol dehydrogenase family)